ncbi:BRCT domain-containing protein, partial [Streptomyces sp. 150FB]|uniref:BRCT domain-containing protein n=1 Tax=Streptomyces sp. 150FB TaxID=1576605 RepID=UPI0032213EEF
LPLLECRPLTEWSDAPARPRVGYQAPYRQQTGWRPARKRVACPYPNPGRYEPGGPLTQGMRVAFSGDTSVDRELLEDRAVEAGLHIAGSVSRLTSLLVTNDPESSTSKTVKAASYGTPVIDEAAFTQLLRDVAPAPGPGAEASRTAPAAAPVRTTVPAPAPLPDPTPVVQVAAPTLDEA